MAKLVEILARELEEWPEQYALIIQDDCGSLHGYLSLSKDDMDQEGLPYDPVEIAWDGASVEVTRAEWQAAVDALKKTEVVEWDGTGLPPVGAVCEFRAPDEFDDFSIWRPELRQGAKVEIIYRYDTGVSDVAVFKFDVAFGQLVEQAGAGCFRPIRTPEQIAAEEREKAACELYCTINWQGGVPEWKNQTADRKNDYFKAIDAGYRKQEPK